MLFKKLICRQTLGYHWFNQCCIFCWAGQTIRSRPWQSNITATEELSWLWGAAWRLQGRSQMSTLTGKAGGWLVEKAKLYIQQRKVCFILFFIQYFLKSIFVAVIYFCWKLFQVLTSVILKLSCRANCYKNCSLVAFLDQVTLLFIVRFKIIIDAIVIFLEIN